MQWTTRLMATGLLLAATLPGGSAFAQVPQTLNYQGYLTDSSGQALLESVVVEFSIYTAESGGVPVWSEFQSVFPSQGLFSTAFGNSSNPFPAGMFDTPLYLGVKVSTDDEMTPRTPLTAAAFSIKAEDAQTVGGMNAGQLDQSTEVNDLNVALGGVQTSVDQISTAVASNTDSVGQIAIAVATNADTTTALQIDIGMVDSEVNEILSNLDVISADIASTQTDVSAIETTLPTLQTRVNGSCAAGTYMRSIGVAGTVTCQADNPGPWQQNGATSYVTGGGRVGIGTSAAAAALQIDAPADVDPFRARVQSSTKLRVHANGSVSVGTSSAGPENGLYVNGEVGLGTTAPNAKLGVSFNDWQFNINNTGVGGDDWFIGSSADTWAAGGGKFLVGQTTSSNAAALAITSSNLVGIGTTSPTTRLNVATGTDVNAVSGGYLMLGSLTGSNVAIDNNEIMGRNNGVASILALNAEGGQVTVNSGGSRDNDSLKVVGRVDFTNGENSGMRISATDSSPTNALFEPTLFEEGLLGFSARPFWRVYSREFYAKTPIDYRTYSDRSIKSNIVPIDSALDKITALEGVSYKLLKSPMGERARPLTKEEQFVEDNQVGFIAQDVAKVLPQLVTQDESSGLYTVAYMGVIPVLVEALKEQQKQIAAQRAELDELKARLN